METFEPNIVMFSCQNCPNQSRNKLVAMQKPHPFGEIRPIFLPCLARLDMKDLLKSLENGADGVLILGCSDKSCLFKEGLDLAKKRIEHVKTILRDIGIEEERVQFIQASSSRALQLAPPRTRSP